MPSPVDRYFKEIKKDNPSYTDEQAWATAWSVFCKHKNPDSEHCKKPAGEYLKKKAMEHPSNEARKKYLHDHPGAEPGDHTVEKGGESKSEGHPQTKDKGSPYYINPSNKHLKTLGDPSDWDYKTVMRIKDKLKKKVLKEGTPAEKEQNEAIRAITNWGLLEKRANSMKTAAESFQNVVTANRVVERFAKDFPSDKALQDYLHDHPKSDKSKHHVVDEDTTKLKKNLKDFSNLQKGQEKAKAKKDKKEDDDHASKLKKELESWRDAK